MQRRRHPHALLARGVRGERHRPRRGGVGARRRSRARRVGVSRDGAAGGGDRRAAVGADGAASAAPRGARHRRAAPRCSLGRARQEHRSPRHQAGQSVPHARGHVEGARFRHREGVRGAEEVDADPPRRRDGHPRVHGARAGAGAVGRGRRAHRHLGGGGDALHAAVGRARPRGADGERAVDLQRDGAGAIRSQRRRRVAALGRRRHRSGARVRSRQALARREGDAGGASGGARRGGDGRWALGRVDAPVDPWHRRPGARERRCADGDDRRRDEHAGPRLGAGARHLQR